MSFIDCLKVIKVSFSHKKRKLRNIINKQRVQRPLVQRRPQLSCHWQRHEKGERDKATKNNTKVIITMTRNIWQNLTQAIQIKSSNYQFHSLAYIRYYKPRLYVYVHAPHEGIRNQWKRIAKVDAPAHCARTSYIER